MTVYDVSSDLKFSGKKVLFDTNVWININGFDPRPEYRIYSDFYSKLLDSDNELVVSDVVLGEFFNACCRIEFRIQQEAGSFNKCSFKTFRSHPDALMYIESVRDTCLNIKDDCEVDQLSIGEYSVEKVILESAEGKLDFNDILIRELCARRDYILVTHDADYKDSGLNLATANKKLLAA